MSKKKTGADDGEQKPTAAPAFLLRNMSLTTQRQFRRRKRAEWRKVLAAIDTYRRGCVYINGYDVFKAFEQHADQITRAISPKEWGQ